MPHSTRCLDACRFNWPRRLRNEREQWHIGKCRGLGKVTVIGNSCNICRSTEKLDHKIQIKMRLSDNLRTYWSSHKDDLKHCGQNALGLVHLVHFSNQPFKSSSDAMQVDIRSQVDVEVASEFRFFKGIMLLAQIVSPYCFISATVVEH